MNHCSTNSFSKQTVCKKAFLLPLKRTPDPDTGSRICHYARLRHVFKGQGQYGGAKRAFPENVVFIPGYEGSKGQYVYLIISKTICIQSTECPWSCKIRVAMYKLTSVYLPIPLYSTMSRAVQHGHSLHPATVCKPLHSVIISQCRSHRQCRPWNPLHKYIRLFPYWIMRSFFSTILK